MKVLLEMREMRGELKPVFVSTEEILAQGHRACQGCGEALAARLVCKALGKDVIIVNATGCLEIISSTLPQTSWRVPWIHTLFENVGAVVSGIEAAYKVLERKGKRKKRKITFLGFAGDGGTSDIGLQALSGALERGHNILFCCFDNEAYMNCLPASSLILTESGMKRIVDVAVGERVYAFDFKTHEITLKRCTGVFSNGVREIYELRTSHHKINATPNHPFLVLRDERVRSLEWKVLADVKPGDKVVVLKDILRAGRGLLCFVWRSFESSEDDVDVCSGGGCEGKNSISEHFETEEVVEVRPAGIAPVYDLHVEGEHNFIADGFVVHNTGIQRSSATPYGASTTTSPAGKRSVGQMTWKKDMPEIAAAHEIPYVATACPSFPLDLMAKVRKGAAAEGPAYIHILSACPTGWRFPPNLTIEIGRLAVETGVFPLYEVENGEYRLNFDRPLKPVREYLMKQGRFKHLTDEVIEKIEKRVREKYERLREKAGVK